MLAAIFLQVLANQKEYFAKLKNFINKIAILKSQLTYI